MLFRCDLASLVRKRHPTTSNDSKHTQAYLPVRSPEKVSLTSPLSVPPFPPFPHAVFPFHSPSASPFPSLSLHHLSKAKIMVEVTFTPEGGKSHPVTVAFPFFL